MSRYTALSLVPLPRVGATAAVALGAQVSCPAPRADGSTLERNDIVSEEQVSHFRARSESARRSAGSSLAAPGHRTKSRLCALVAAAWTALAAVTAHADSPPDTVWNAMKERPVVIERDDGPTVVGKLIGIDATTVVVLTSTGEPVTIQRATVRSLRADTSAPEVSPAPAPAKAPPSESEGGSGTLVHIDSNKPELQLYRITAQATYAIAGRGGVVTAYAPVCTAPCDRVVDGSRGEQFFLSAGGPRVGPLFHLYDRDRSGKVMLKADIRRFPRPGLLVGGIALMAGGAAAAAVGVLVATTSIFNFDYDLNRPPPDEGSPAGWGVMGGGIALIGGGIVMTVLSRGDYDVQVPQDAGLSFRGVAFTPPVRVGTETLPASGSLSFTF